MGSASYYTSTRRLGRGWTRRSLGRWRVRFELRNFRERNLTLCRNRREGRQSYVVIVIGGRTLSLEAHPHRRLGARSLTLSEVSEVVSGRYRADVG